MTRKEYIKQFRSAWKQANIARQISFMMLDGRYAENSISFAHEYQKYYAKSIAYRALALLFAQFINREGIEP